MAKKKVLLQVGGTTALWVTADQLDLVYHALGAYLSTQRLPPEDRHAAMRLRASLFASSQQAEGKAA